MRLILLPFVCYMWCVRMTACIYNHYSLGSNQATESSMMPIKIWSHWQWNLEKEEITIIRWGATLCQRCGKLKLFSLFYSIYWADEYPEVIYSVKSGILIMKINKTGYSKFLPLLSSSFMWVAFLLNSSKYRFF